MEKREQRSDDSAGLTLLSLRCKVLPAPVRPPGVCSTWVTVGDAAEENLGRASRGWRGAGWVGHQVLGELRGDGPLSAASAPSPTPLLCPVSWGSPLACRAARAAGAPGCQQIQLSTPVRQRGRRGCRSSAPDSLVLELSRDSRAPEPFWTTPGCRGRVSDRNSWGGPLPYLTPCSAALYCPALAGCLVARRAASSLCQVPYRDPMALDTSWCWLPRMNNVIAGITVKHSLPFPLIKR